MKGGEVHDPSALFESVRGRLGPAAASNDDHWKGNIRYFEGGS
jgi:hypothetical protein